MKFCTHHPSFLMCCWLVATPFLSKIYGQSTPNQRIFQEKIALARAAADFPEACLAVGKSFLNQPYRSGTLDATPHETLALRFDAFDCWTFVENVLAIVLVARLPAGAVPTLEMAHSELLKMRYRNGQMEGYGSRIHYFSEWMLQARTLGSWTDVTSQCSGSTRFSKNIYFMSKNPQFYPKLQADTAAMAQIIAAERRIQQQSWQHIPKEKVPLALKNIRSGDLLAFTSNRPGLDIEHEGFAIWQNGKLHLLHASSDAGRVVISQRPVSEYILKNRRQAGLMVLRWNAVN